VADLSAIVKAYDIRGIVGEQLDAEIVRDIGAAFADLD
jgi:phosphomannomutase